MTDKGSRMYVNAGLTVPHSFQVIGGERVIIVQGSVIRVELPLRRGRTFSVQDAAGLTVHAPKGRSFENILFDSQGQALCRFARGEKNGEVFLQYLYNQGVPFFRPNGQPLETAAPPVESGGAEHAGPRFTLELRRTVPVLMWIGAGLFLSLVLFNVGIPVVAMLSGPHIKRNLGILIAVFFVVLIGPLVLSLLSGQLFQPRLTVANGRIWVSYDFACRELPLNEIDCLRFQRSDACYVLYDKKGRARIKFSTKDDFGPEFLDFLICRNIKLCSS